MPSEPPAFSVSSPLRVIPVLDLSGGQVVRAVRGERSSYRAIRSRLAAGSDPCSLAAAMLAAARHCNVLRRADGRGDLDGPADGGGEQAIAATVETIYVADLDALQHGRPQASVVASLLAALPQAEIWLDAGFASAAAADVALRRFGDERCRLRPVYGSETPRPADALKAIAADDRAILSLDARAGVPIDPSGCWQEARCWPPTMIAMTLDRVGSAAGPDLDRFSALRDRAPSLCWVGAGGIRDAGDLAEARAAGASAWLVASALHDRLLGATPEKTA